MTATVAIGEAVTGGALRATHFFNGRLLTGEDLGREQTVQSTRVARLGRALGDGVVDGFGVAVAAASSAANPIVTISPGHAVARTGAGLELGVQTDVSLAGSGPRPGAEPGALFADCQPYQPSEYSTGVGVYLLSVGPKVISEGLAPVSGLHNADAPCNTAYAVEGVSFRRLRLAIPLAELDDRDHLRNRVAYRMFAPAEVDALWRDPFGPGLGGYGLLDELRPDYLHDDEVPLALIGWEAGKGITFVDHWSVRRRVTRATGPDPFGPFAGDRLLAEGEARFLQFQAQLDDSRLTVPNPRAFAVESAFTLLPPLGLLPVSPGLPRRFDHKVFFGALKTNEPAYIAAAQVGALVRESFAFPPIEPDSEELLWLYRVRDNARDAVARQYVIFAHGQMPYAGDARFDLAYWDFSNYALTP